MQGYIHILVKIFYANTRRTNMDMSHFSEVIFKLVLHKRSKKKHDHFEPNNNSNNIMIVRLQPFHL